MVQSVIRAIVKVVKYNFLFLNLIKYLHQIYIYILKDGSSYIWCNSYRVIPFLYCRFLINPTIEKIALNDYFFPLIYLINNNFSLSSFITFHRSHWILFNGVPCFLKFLLLDNVSSVMENAGQWKRFSVFNQK